MKTFDDIYCKLGYNLLVAGEPQLDLNSVRTVYADGTKATTHSIEGVSFVITPDMGVPILRSKRIGVKTPLIELEWIWQEMSNNVSWLKERNVHIWDEWEQADGTIGKSYGYQLRTKRREMSYEVAARDNCGLALNQVEYVLHELKYNPSSRRIMTTLWDVDDLDVMALEPCVWATHWTVQDNKLNLHVKQRSGDFCLGVPYNVYQYSVLHAYVAKFIGLELGNMYWNIDNLHVYDRHIDTLKKQLAGYTQANSEEVGIVTLNIPENFNVRSFYANKLSSFTVSNYNPIAEYKYEVAI